MRILPQAFFERHTAVVARDLLGLWLCHRTPGGLLVGRIVETEAYLGATDAASHAARGRTARNHLMFEAPGHAYVYFSYGNHWCFNAVAWSEPPGAVLLRAVEPLQGQDDMAARRQSGRRAFKSVDLTNGPGKLTQAFALTGEHNGAPLFDNDALFIAKPGRRPSLDVGAGPRIGITQSVDLPLRFVVRESAYLSRPAPAHAS